MPRPLRFALVSLGLAAALAAAIPTAQTPAPTPKAWFGFEPCADYELATYEQSEGYFRQLADRSSGRMRIVEMGPTVQGRTQIMAVISSATNLERMDAIKATSRALATVREDGHVIGEARARELARGGTAVVWIDFGLHSSEVAPAQAAPLLAYDLVTSDSPDIAYLRDNVVLLLVPNMNPDGTTMVADWYRRHRGQPWEGTPPELWHVYAGHDNNRDFYMFTQPESRNAARQLYEEWFPQIVYDHHQAGPFPARIFVPPFDDPVNPNIPPAVMQGVNAVGDAIARRLAREGKRGVVSRVGFDAWWNGGMRTAPYFHNMIGILTETSHPSATPANNDPRRFPRTFANGVSTREPSKDYPAPYLGGTWHLRDSCDYIVTASMAVLDVGARHREEWLYGISRMGRDAVERHRGETYLIPARQWDPGAAETLVDVLRMGGVQIEQATAPFVTEGGSYDAGTFIIPGGQAFEPYVRDLLTPQVYPETRLGLDGPPARPYDASGWTLSLQMGVRVDHVNHAVAPPRVIVRRPSTLASGVSRGVKPGTLVAIDPRANNAFAVANRWLAAGRPVFRSVDSVRTARGDWPPGTFLVRLDGREVGGPDAPLALVAPASRDGLRADRAVWRLRPPRVGVYHAWGGNVDEGWTRWALEQFDFPYTSLRDTDIRGGALATRFDTIVLPDATAAEMIAGLASGAMPAEYVGGMSEAGVRHLRAFVEAGGTLVALGRAAELAIQALDLPVRDVTADATSAEFLAPGTILRLHPDPAEPVAYGLPPDAAAFVAASPAFAISDPRRARPVAIYPAGDLLLSGWLLGEPVLSTRAAVVDVTVGRGRALLLGFRTHHRGQSHGTFKLLFNAVFLGSSEPAALPD